MSGRVRTVLADGRRVTGFRKTLRRNPRLSPEQRPELRLTFTLPPQLSAFTRSGIYGSVEVDIDGMVTIRGKDRDWMLRKAAEFMKGIAHGLTLDPIAAVMFTPSHPAPTLGAPARPGGQDSYEIVVATGQPAVSMVRGGVSRPITVT